MIDDQPLPTAASGSNVLNRLSAVLQQVEKDEAPSEPLGGPCPAQIDAATLGLVEIERRFETVGGVRHARPVGEPAGVADLADHLLSPFDIAEGGRIHLAGCSLDERPLLWVVFQHENLLQEGSQQENSPRAVSQRGDEILQENFFDAAGVELDTSLVASLGLRDVHGQKTPPQDLAWQIPRLSATAKQAVHDLPSPPDGKAPPRFIACVIVWCRYASGKLEVEFGEQSLNIPFEGWARHFADGTRKVPPLKCPHTGIPSYGIVQDDHGRISVKEAVSTCDVTGQRVVQSDLVQCRFTGKRALAEHTDSCSISGDAVLKDQLAVCGMCSQRVNPALIKRGHCRACRSLARVSKSDPRMALILGAYPTLDGWRHWSLAETQRVYILVGRGLVRRILVVAQKDPLEIVRVASGNRFSGNWTDAPADLRRELSL